MKNTLGVIPARMSSSRFPGKPLEKILNIPMLAHCYERALLSGVCDNLVIATPDQEIIDITDGSGAYAFIWDNPNNIDFPYFPFSSKSSVYESRINRWINYCCVKETKINSLNKLT